MAYKISSGTVQPAANSIAAHNLTHKSAAAAEIAASTKAHYDGVEVGVTGVAETISATLSAPSTLADAVTVFNEAKRILNLHYGYHNTGGTAGVFAHKAATTAIAVADLSAGSVYDAAALAAVKALIDEFRVDYEAHRVNVTFHAAADTTNVLGGSPTITTWADAAEALNNMKAQLNAHVPFSSGASPHANPGTTLVTAANAVSTDIDSCITLANDIKAKYNSHRTEATVHSTNDTTNVLSASNAALSTDLTDSGGLPNTIRTSYEAHRASTTYHESADSTNTISASTYGTAAQLIALAVELRTDIDAHLAYAPVSRAQRGV